MDMSVKLSQVYPSVLPQAPVADRDPAAPAKVQEAAAPKTAALARRPGKGGWRDS